MINKYEVLYFSAESGDKEVLVSPNVSLLKAEVKSGTLTVKAMLDRESEALPVAGISAKTFESMLNMTGPDLYNIDVSGYYKLIFTYSGGDDVYIKTLC